MLGLVWWLAERDPPGAQKQKHKQKQKPAGSAQTADPKLIVPRAVLQEDPDAPLEEDTPPPMSEDEIRAALMGRIEIEEEEGSCSSR